MKEKRITGNAKNYEPFYSDILKLSKKKEITIQAARKELLSKVDNHNKDKYIFNNPS